MHHEHSIFFGIFNRLLEALLGPVSGAPEWWRKGIDLGSFHVDGVAARNEAGEAVAWIPDHLAMALFVFLVCAIFFPLAARTFRKDAAGGIQNVLELVVDFLRGLIRDNIEHGERFLPIVGAFFLFIFLCNICSLFFFLQPPTANLNVTAALAITCFFYFNIAGIRANGPIGYMKNFMGPLLLLSPLMFVIEMIGNFARMLSLSMRLYGNISGEHLATGIFVGMVPVGVPMPLMALGIFGALMQAYVFTFLTTLYLGGATAHEH